MNVKSIVTFLLMTLLILQKNYASDITLMPEQNRVVLEMTVQRGNELMQQDEEAQVSKRRKRLAYYLLGGAAVGACLVGVYFYLKKSNQQAPTNNLPHQQNTPNNQVQANQSNPQNPQVQPQNIPVQNNAQNAPPAGPNVRVRFQGVNYPDIAQVQERAEWIFMNDLRLHNGNIDHAIQTLVNEYVIAPGIRLHIHYEAIDQNGFLTDLGGIFS